jgi:hypothetical protein
MRLKRFYRVGTLFLGLFEPRMKNSTDVKQCVARACVAAQRLWVGGCFTVRRSLEQV